MCDTVGSQCLTWTEAAAGGGNLCRVIHVHVTEGKHSLPEGTQVELQQIGKWQCGSKVSSFTDKWSDPTDWAEKNVNNACG